MVFIAELFWWFEMVKPDFVQPRDLQEVKDGEICEHVKASRKIGSSALDLIQVFLVYF